MPVILPGTADRFGVMTRRRRGLLSLTRFVAVAWCVGCTGSGADGTRSGDMFFNKKSNDSTTVHPSVGAALVRASQYPAAPPAQIGLRQTCKRTALDGVPPQATFRGADVPGQTSAAYVVERGGSPPLALVNVRGGNSHIEAWELSSTDKPTFVRQRTMRLDPEQSSWVGYLLSDVACLPENRVLLAVFYYAPQVKQALFVNDIARDTISKIANVAPDPVNRDKFFEAQNVAPEATIVLYYTGSTRTSPEVYYNAFNHLVLFDARHPDGLEVLKLAAADGAIERWHVADKTLWLQAADKRDPRRTTQFVWSLDLSKVLP